jgi:outer membrane protein insertion porin family
MALLAGCTLPSRQSGRLGGRSALEQHTSAQQRLEQDQPLPDEYAASRMPRGGNPAQRRFQITATASSDDGISGGVIMQRDARAPTTLGPRGARPYGDETEEEEAANRAYQSRDDWDDASTWSGNTHARVAYSPAPASQTAQPGAGQWPPRQPAGGAGIVVRGQSPTYGGQMVPTLPRRTPGANLGLPDPIAAPTGGTPAVPAGFGVNEQYAQTPPAQPPSYNGFPQQPNTVYQVPAGGVPAQPAMMTPFAPNDPSLQPDSVQNLDVIGMETQTGRLMVGVGINSDAGLVGNLVIDEQNFDLFRPSFRWADWVNGTAFRGAGQRFRIEAMPGTEVQRYAFNFQDPYFLDTPFSFGVSAFYFQRNYTDWDEQRTGIGLNFGYLFPERPDLSLSFGIRAEAVNISDPSTNTVQQLNEVVGNNQLYTGRVQLAHDTRDSSFLPTEGHFMSLAFEQGFGTFSFPRFEADFRKYWWTRERPDGSGRHILGLSGKLGVAGSDTPIFEHFYAGGFSTLRGFAFRGASPQQNGVTVGGEFELITSVEYRFPLTANDMLFGSFFVDAGTVEPNANLYADNFRVTPGFELRISVPAMGPIPIAVGIGVPVAHAPGDDIQNFHFFFGVTR